MFFHKCLIHSKIKPKLPPAATAKERDAKPDFVKPIMRFINAVRKAGSYVWNSAFIVQPIDRRLDRVGLG